MVLTNKWFSKSSDIVTGITQNEQFADRLNSVWIKFPCTSGLRPGKVITVFARLGKFLMNLNERVNKLEEAARPKDAIRIPSIEEGSLTGRYSSEDYKRTSTERIATGILASSNEAALRKFRLPPYVAPTTADRAVSLISAVLDGRVVSATIRQAGLRITVEKDNE